MAQKTVVFSLGSAVTSPAGTVTVAYPSGTTQASFTGDNALGQGVAILNNNDIYTEVADKVDITYGVSDITLTNKSGRTWAAGEEVTLGLAYVADTETAIDGLTATANQINNLADPGTNFIEVTNATGYTVLAANSGKIHYLPDFTAACTIDLPVPTAGLEFDFVYVGNALDAHGFILDAQSDTNFFKGGVLHLDADAQEAADELVAVYPDGDSNSKLTATSVGAGTRVKVKSLDGTTWTIIDGRVCGNTAPTFANQS